MKRYRQGDVIIEEFSGSMPEKAELKNNRIIALGLATRNAHRVLNEDAELYTGDNESMFLVSKSNNTEIFHEEHESIYLDLGVYEIKIQREFDWFNKQIRKVQD